MSRRLGTALLWAALASMAALPAWAQPAASAPRTAVAAPPSGPPWSALTPAQRAALAPLQAHWAGIDAERKTKWLAIAQRFPSLPPVERERVQARMTQWAAMSPAERGRARLNYQELRKLPSADRQASWEAYRALPAEERQELARRAAPPPARSVAPRTPPAATATLDRKRPVPVNPQASPVKPVTPTVVQVKPGATTTLLSKPASPPQHTQPGLPKIAATPDFVNPDTLLPNRGPQGAAAIKLSNRPQAAASAGS